MYKVLTLNNISEAGLSQLDPAKYTVGSDIKDPDAILVRSANMHDMEFSPNTLAIARAGAGTNNVPVDRCAEEGIVVFNTPGANANAVKELVLCSLFLTSRKIIPGVEFANSLKGKGDEVGALVEKGKSAFAGPEISGKTLGVVGLGAIGVRVANAARTLGMKVYGYDPFLSVDAAWNLSSHIVHAKNLDEIFQNCDYITVHVPLTDETRDTVCKESLAKMKDGVRILNFARGELVNTEDLIEALESGKVAAYATDFADDALLGIPGVITMPHLGASTPESEDNCAQMAAYELVEYIENGNIRNSVNLPNADMARVCKNRLCVIHKNVPNVLRGITSQFVDSNINDFMNRSKGDISYTILEVNGDISDEMLDTIREIPGVVRVRAIYG
ncbi:MAG: phosphoglycerate dehydrogenase [Clostridia bacterium]|nr:phosphoglycerate dehydrogenase [Clostridia bacterium]